MADPRIVSLNLDEKSVVRRSPEVEHERAIAIFDILEENRFAPAGHDGGPYDLRLSIEDRQRLVMEVNHEDGEPVARVTLSLTPFRRIVKDYFQICESYFDAIKRLSPSQIETIDMARRGLHNEGSEMLIERLKDKIELDRDTARRLFTLICVLHIRG
ncbi:MAG TPA: UPF0262 family protein [Halothiobacillaceae bacterium]|nr:UPF0262 family protein [Halothiobacillaceae bacterium]